MSWPPMLEWPGDGLEREARVRAPGDRVTVMEVRASDGRTRQGSAHAQMHTSAGMAGWSERRSCSPDEIG